MAILYLTEQQAWVAREGECLIVHIPERDEQGKRMAKARTQNDRSRFSKSKKSWCWAKLPSLHLL